MRPALSCFLLVFALSAVKGQEPPVVDSASMLSTYRRVTIKLQDPERQHPNDLPFHHFEILDERPDTLRIGAHTGAGLFGKGNRQLGFAGQTSWELANYLDVRFSRPQGPFTALIALRNLWFSDATYTLADLSKDTSASHVKIRIRLKAEVYAEKDGIYTPLFRLNSIGESQSGSYLSIGQDLGGMLDDLADSAAILIDRKGMGGRHLSRDDIRQFNRSRFDLVIYTDTALVSGVYLSFEEFRNNAPSIRNFEVLPNTQEDKDNKNLLLYLKGSGNESIYTRDAWGYCDGMTVYVMKDGVLVPTWREGKAYYLLGLAEEIDIKKNRLGWLDAPYTMDATSPGTTTMNPGGGTTDPKLTLKHVFAVDMDTGKLY